jgi:hypothetical protein
MRVRVQLAQDGASAAAAAGAKRRFVRMINQASGFIY